MPRGMLGSQHGFKPNLMRSDCGKNYSGEIFNLEKKLRTSRMFP